MTGAPGSPPERLYTHPLLLMLLLTYACNFMDRTVVGTLAQAIKLDLKISDSQLGLLQGFAFVVLYSAMGIPIAHLAERVSRINLLAICMAAWSVLTMLCGTAQSFGQLLLLRIGVGIGEAGCNAPSHSVIADIFAPQQRSRAVSVYNMGATTGTMLGAMLGGVIAQTLGWRAAFVIVGAPGLVLAVLMRTRFRDPGRQPAVSSDDQTPSAARASDVLAMLVGNPTLRHLTLGFALTSFGSAGLGAFTQPYYIRTFGLSYAQIGLIFGFFGGLSALLSLVISGRLVDAVAQRDPRWHAWLPAFGVAVAAPFAAAAFTNPHWPVALALGFVYSLFVNFFIAPTLGAVHKIVGPRRVAMSLALLLMFQNLVGLGAGPFVTGVLIDHASAHLFGALGLGSFAQHCPGGVALTGSPAMIMQACHVSLARATRSGLLLTLLAFPLAVLNFLLAARDLRRALPEAASPAA